MTKREIEENVKRLDAELARLRQAVHWQREEARDWEPGDVAIVPDGSRVLLLSGRDDVGGAQAVALNGPGRYEYCYVPRSRLLCSQFVGRHHEVYRADLREVV